MLEGLLARVEDRARHLADRHRTVLARRLATEAPPDVVVETDAEAVRLSARGLSRRLALDPAMHWLFAETGR
jgi:hypothetical protein